MISCSMSHSLMGALWDWRTKTSQPRTDSENRT